MEESIDFLSKYQMAAMREPGIYIPLCLHLHYYKFIIKQWNIGSRGAL